MLRAVDRSLQPLTEVGKRFVAQCEEHAEDFASRADEHDRESSFPTENVDAMKASGAIAACVPAELGGGGLTSVHDLAVGMNRLGRADGSTAIAMNMHLAATFGSARAWRAATARGIAATAIATMLEAVVGGSLVACILGTEAGAMSNYCETALTPVEGGYRLDGRKIFGTLSPAANLLLVLARLPSVDGDLLALAPVAASADGVTPLDDWDALGMRASGSQTVEFSEVFVPEGALLPWGPWGGPSATALVGQVVGTAGLAAAFLGIAEDAQRRAIALVSTRRKVPSTRPLAHRAPIQHLVAENEVALSTARASLERAATLADAALAAGEPALADAHVLMAEMQAAKLYVELGAVAVVDRALTLSGGAGYMSANPLSRLYRDVRAGPFMQQYSPVEAYEYIGKVVLGLDPELDL